MVNITGTFHVNMLVVSIPWLALQEHSMLTCWLSLSHGYRQFGGHKNRENKLLKIEFNFLIVCVGLIWVFIHVRLTIQRIRIFALVDKKLFIYLMQNSGSFTCLMLRGVQRTLEELLNTPVRTGIKYL